MIRYRQTGHFFPAFYLSEKHVSFLSKNFSFFQKLPSESKKVFQKRVAYFISTKKFIPRKMDKVTWEMKVLVAASAIQLTFGYPKVNLSFFKNIVIFPESFFSSSNQAFHKGEVNPKMKAIALSWKDFVEGYLSLDGRNLGLHEMAHALHLENRIRNEEYNFLDKKWLKDWEQHAQKTMAEINLGEESFFRQYGGANREEFFAVAVENFFERPIEFKEKHPFTFRTLSLLLRQDPSILEKPNFPS